MEETIADPRIHDQTVEDVRYPVTYQLIEAGTKHAWTKLPESDGYSYNLQVFRTNVTYWQCTVRPTGNHCKAIVIQRGDGFQQGKHNHNHPPALWPLSRRKQLRISLNQRQRSSMRWVWKYFYSRHKLGFKTIEIHGRRILAIIHS